jgi:ppGpp synthetase/RelA/SpoT-type nucleotidyltranferase
MEIDRESAFEILSAKIKRAEIQEQREAKRVTPTKTATRRRLKEDDSILEALSKNTMARQIGRAVIREVMRGLLGVLGIKR